MSEGIVAGVGVAAVISGIASGAGGAGGVGGALATGTAGDSALEFCGEQPLVSTANAIPRSKNLEIEVFINESLFRKRLTIT